MRKNLVCFAAPLVVGGLFAMTACSSKSTNNPGSGGSGGSSSSSSSGSAGSTTGSGGGGAGGSSTTSSTSTAGSTSSSSGGTTTGWTIVPLIDDTTDPNETVFRKGSDLVTGIYFASIDDGWITTTGDQETFQNGGAIFKTKQKQVQSVLFNGNRDGLCLGGTINFHGLDKTQDGLVGLAYACDIIASHDNGKTFGIQSALAGDMFGIEGVLTMRSLPTATYIVTDSGYIASTDGAPGPNALWTDVWAPEGVPPTPNPVPADECQTRPQTSRDQRTAVYVSPDAKLFAYAALEDAGPSVCISTDNGKSFFPKTLSGTSSDSMAFKPNGVVFANATTGIAFWANNIYQGQAYIFQTTDAGKTWKSVTVPAAAQSKSIEFQSAFFAPDGMHGWIVGYDYDSSLALILRSEDGGATWTRSGGDLASKVSKAGGGKLFSGFALDANHIWVGGEWGILASSDTSGQ